MTVLLVLPALCIGSLSVAAAAKDLPPASATSQPSMASMSMLRESLRAHLVHFAATTLDPTMTAEAKDDSGRVRQRWHLHSEPSAVGVVPLLCVFHPQQRGTPDRRPVVIVMHGTGSRKEEVSGHLERFADQGYLGVAVDSRYHGDRAGSFKDYIVALIAAFEAGERGDATAEHPFMYDTVSDMVKVLDWLVARNDVDPDRIGMTGISLGGMHTWLTAAVDERIAAAAPLIGVQGYKWAIDHDKWQGRVESIQPLFDHVAASSGHPIDTSLVDRVWRAICPRLVDDDEIVDAPSSLRLIAPRPLLVANGERDHRCPMEGVKAAVESAKVAWEMVGKADLLELHFEPGGGHEVSPHMWHLVDDFFNRHLQPTTTCA
eukprot:SAG31_NODE_694_length_12769_cov_8.102447_13_plen_375_part_00